MSLLFNILSRFVIAFLPRSKHLLISWLQSPSAVNLEPTKIKSVTVPNFPPSICHEVIGLAAMIFVFWMLSFKSAFHGCFTSINFTYFHPFYLSVICWYLSIRYLDGLLSFTSFYHTQWFLVPKKIVCHCFHCFPIYLPWNDGTGCHDPRFLNVEF